MNCSYAKDGKIEYAYKTFGRSKTVSVNYYETPTMGSAYVHLKNVKTKKSISLGLDELKALARFADEVIRIGDVLEKENEEEEEVQLPDVEANESENESEDEDSNDFTRKEQEWKMEQSRKRQWQNQESQETEKVISANELEHLKTTCVNHRSIVETLKGIVNSLLH